MLRCALALVALCIVSASGHALFKCPAPRLDSSSYLKEYPCGSGDENNNFDGIFTDIAPGLLTVVVKETVSHNGSPYRIALSVCGDDSFESIVLLDHIPHWDDGPAVPRDYYINVEIPDVDCGDSNCVLQVLQIMTDKIASDPGYCGCVDGPSPDCFSVYHSCANVHISGTTPINDYVHTYTPPAGFLDETPNVWYKGEAGDWTNGWSDLQDGQIYQSGVCGTCVTGDDTQCANSLSTTTGVNGNAPVCDAYTPGPSRQTAEQCPAAEDLTSNGMGSNSASSSSTVRVSLALIASFVLFWL